MLKLLSFVAIVVSVIRTILYPLTAFMGPLFNDWFGEQVRVNSALGLSLKSNCESRKAETEADLLGLRILVGAGINPHAACDLWSSNGVFYRWSLREAERLAADTVAASADDGDESWLAKNGFLSTHPMDDTRFHRIAMELQHWETLTDTSRAANAAAEASSK